MKTRGNLFRNALLLAISPPPQWSPGRLFWKGPCSVQPWRRYSGAVRGWVRVTRRLCGSSPDVNKRLESHPPLGQAPSWLRWSITWSDGWHISSCGDGLSPTGAHVFFRLILEWKYLVLSLKI